MTRKQNQKRAKQKTNKTKNEQNLSKTNKNSVKRLNQYQAEGRETKQGSYHCKYKTKVGKQHDDNRAMCGPHCVYSVYKSLIY